jgi:hypothetical protein
MNKVCDCDIIIYLSGSVVCSIISGRSPVGVEKKKSFSVLFDISVSRKA